MAPRRPNIARRGAQEGLATAPRAPKNAPRAGQDSPKTACLSLRRGAGMKDPPPILINAA
eukprot:6532451-Pyramimonas_sp.AAC.1